MWQNPATDPTRSSPTSILIFSPLVSTADYIDNFTVSVRYRNPDGRWTAWIQHLQYLIIPSGTTSAVIGGLQPNRTLEVRISGNTPTGPTPFSPPLRARTLPRGKDRLKHIIFVPDVFCGTSIKLEQLNIPGSHD